MRIHSLNPNQEADREDADDLEDGDAVPLKVVRKQMQRGAPPPSTASLPKKRLPTATIGVKLDLCFSHALGISS